MTLTRDKGPANKPVFFFSSLTLSVEAEYTRTSFEAHARLEML